MRKRSEFLLSLPERTLRSLAAVSGGLIREIGNVILPARVRRTTLYRVTVELTLRFLIEEVGQVNNIYPSEDRLAGKFLLRRGASHGIELIGLATLHVSPIWVLAALADALGAGKYMIAQISTALKQEGLLSPEAQLESIDDLLAGLERTSTHLANALNMPPVDIASLRREWKQLREELPRVPAPNLPSISQIEELWNDIVVSAATQRRPVVLMASLFALSTVSNLPENVIWLSKAAQVAARRTGSVLGEALLSHYRACIAEVSAVGFAAYWRGQFRPYLRAAAAQFTRDSSSTERLLRPIQSRTR